MKTSRRIYVRTVVELRLFAAAAAKRASRTPEGTRRPGPSFRPLSAAEGVAVSGERLSQAANRLQLWMWLCCVCGLSLRLVHCSDYRCSRKRFFVAWMKPYLTS